jgi:hypothetical protein
MKTIFLFLILCVTSLNAQDLASFRAKYSTVNANQKNTEDFIAFADKAPASNTPAIIAYKASAQFLKAKLNIEKGKRIQYIKAGAKSLDTVIGNSPENPELRMIRLSIQENLPKIVGYSKNIKEDKEIILEFIGEQPADLKKYIRNFIAQSKSFTAQEKTSLNK